MHRRWNGPQPSQSGAAHAVEVVVPHGVFRRARILKPHRRQPDRSPSPRAGSPVRPHRARFADDPQTSPGSGNSWATESMDNSAMPMPMPQRRDAVVLPPGHFVVPPPSPPRNASHYSESTDMSPPSPPPPPQFNEPTDESSSRMSSTTPEPVRDSIILEVESKTITVTAQDRDEERRDRNVSLYNLLVSSFVPLTESPERSAKKIAKQAAIFLSAFDDDASWEIDLSNLPKRHQKLFPNHKTLRASPVDTFRSLRFPAVRFEFQIQTLIDPATLRAMDSSKVQSLWKAWAAPGAPGGLVAYGFTKDRLVESYSGHPVIQKRTFIVMKIYETRLFKPVSYSLPAKQTVAARAQSPLFNHVLVTFLLVFAIQTFAATAIWGQMGGFVSICSFSICAVLLISVTIVQ